MFIWAKECVYRIASCKTIGEGQTANKITKKKFRWTVALLLKIYFD
jgi:hypothetical protein